jgi:hypothetical protein
VRFLHLLGKRGLPSPDATGWEGADFVWKQDRVVVCLDTPAPSVLERFESRSMTPIVFGEDEHTWNERLAELATALGKV